MDTVSHHQALLRTSSGLQLAAVPTPSPKAGGVLVAPSFVGVCGTDLQILNGARPDTASILGHEASGVVVRAGQGAALKEGQSIVFNPSAQLKKGRILGHNVPGLFQQYFLVDEQAVQDGLVQAVEEGLPRVCGALVEPLAGVIYTHELISHIVPQVQSAVVFGAGPIGLITTEYLRSRGARVLLIHSSQKRLDTAVELDFLESDSAMLFGNNLSERILGWNSGRWLDAAVICTSMEGASAALTHGMDVLKSGGCIEMVTNFPAGAPTPEGITAAALREVRAANICGVPEEGAYVKADISGRAIAFTSHRGTSRTHLSQAMHMLNSTQQRYTRLITHVVSLQQAAGVIETLSRTRKASIDGRDCIKAVVDLTPLGAQ